MTPDKPLLWLRAEHKSREARAAVVPSAAARLVSAGYEVVVESSADRAFPIESYVAAGCGTAAKGAWRERAPDDAIVIGLKELDPALGPFRHRHVHFAHAFKGQRGWRETLRAFAAGGGTLFDLEYLVDGDGRRVAAFGERAGFVGAALALLAWAGRREGREPVLGALEPWTSGAALIEDVRDALARAGAASGAPEGIDIDFAAGDTIGGDVDDRPRVLVVGARGRSGRGAVAVCEAVGARVTSWDVDETADGGPFEAVRDHDVLVSCVFVDAPLPPFTTRAELERPGRRLSVVADVGCDPFGEYNPLPLYTATTSLGEPVRRLIGDTREAAGRGTGAGDPPLDLIAIDHLPSLLPVESSEEFSARLLPFLLELDRPADGVWGRAAAVFEERLREALDGDGPGDEGPGDDDVPPGSRS